MILGQPFICLTIILFMRGVVPLNFSEAQVIHVLEFAERFLK